MLYNVIDVRYTPREEAWDAFEEAMIDHKLVFNARSLCDVGFEPNNEVTAAVERAMRICSSNGLSIKEHFKTIYISDSDTHTVQRDWKLSKLAYTLAMMNGASDNPMVGRLQFEVLKNYLTNFKKKE
jgi:hypothetical protein